MMPVAMLHCSLSYQMKIPFFKTKRGFGAENLKSRPRPYQNLVPGACLREKKLLTPHAKNYSEKNEIRIPQTSCIAPHHALFQLPFPIVPKKKTPRSRSVEAARIQSYCTKIPSSDGVVL
jgi:hypothetical protein